MPKSSADRAQLLFPADSAWMIISFSTCSNWLSTAKVTVGLAEFVLKVVRNLGGKMFKSNFITFTNDWRSLYCIPQLLCISWLIMWLKCPRNLMINLLHQRRDSSKSSDYNFTKKKDLEWSNRGYHLTENTKPLESKKGCN